MGEGKSRKAETDSAREAERALKRSTELKNLIDNDIEEMKGSFSKAEEEIKEKEQEIETNVGNMNEAVALMHSTADSTVSAIEAKVKDATSDVDSTYRTFENFGTIIPVATLIVYYVGYLVVHGFSYDVSVFGGVAIVAPLALVLRVILNQMHTRLQSQKNKTLENVKAARQGLGTFLVKKLNLEPGLKRISDGFSKASRYGESLLSGVRDYLPEVERYYSGRERINRQEVFRKTLRHALTSFGFSLDPKAEEYLTTFGPLTNSEDEWLVQSAKGLSPILGVSKELLVLIYSDYVGDLQALRNVWLDVSKSQDLIRELSKILIKNEVVETAYVEKDLPAYEAVENLIAGDIPFDLDKFKHKYAEYYGEYAKEKRALIDALQEYRIELSFELKEKIRKFMPSSFDEGKRKEELFILVANGLDLQVKIIELAYYEREAETTKRIQTWEALNKENTNLSKLVSLIVNNRLVDVPSPYEDNIKEVNRFVAQVISVLPDFTLAKAKNAVRKNFESLDLQKATFLRALHANKIIPSEADREEFGKWLSTDIAPEGTARWLQERVGVPSSVTTLFYYDYIQDSRLRKQHFSSMRESGRLIELAQVLIEQKIIPTHENEKTIDENPVANLELLLTQAEDYDRSELQSSFSTYNQLLNYSKGILEFLKNQSLIAASVELGFEQLVSGVEIMGTSTLRQLQLIIGSLIGDHAPPEFNSNEWHEPVTMATLTMYLVVREDILQTEACRLAGSNDGATRVLYQFSRINDEEEQRGSKTKTSFMEIIKKTIDGTYTNYDYIEPFKKELASGFLFQRISHMQYARLIEIDRRISDKQKLEEKLRTYSGAVDTFLQSKLQVNVILESLRMQLVAAYMITNPSAGDVITGIIDKYLREACKELAQDNPLYQNLLLLSEDSFGRGTRVGIVPFRMDFDEFSRHFERAFQLAVRQYVASGAPHPPEEFSGNVIRIFPSDAYFKRIEVTSQTSSVLSEDHPVQIIRKLVLKYYGPVENLELIASLQGEADKTIAMRSLLQTFFDTASKIYLMAENQLKGILAGSRFLDYVRDGNLDQDLVSSFNCATRSQLAMTIHQSAGPDAANAPLVSKKLADELARVAKQSGARLGPDVVKAVAGVVFQVLFDIGMVLHGLRS